MKTLLLLLLSLNALAFEVPSELKPEFDRRIELYGLKKPKPLIPTQIESEYDTSIVQLLQKDIKEDYIPKLESELGSCEKENCINQVSDYKTLELADKTVCLPYTQCGFYKCMEKKYQCKPEGVGYFTDLAFPTCSTYTRNIQKKWFTQKGYNWIYTVMVCLQKGLIDECELTENCNKETQKKSCDYITDFTLKFHPGCYINSGVGVCKLPMKDKINIWRTVGKFLTDREREEAFKVVLSCLKKEKGLE